MKIKCFRKEHCWELITVHLLAETALLTAPPHQSIIRSKIIKSLPTTSEKNNKTFR